LAEEAQHAALRVCGRQHMALRPALDHIEALKLPLSDAKIHGGQFARGRLEVLRFNEWPHIGAEVQRRVTPPSSSFTPSSF
jgi:hypothetical protein